MDRLVQRDDPQLGQLNYQYDANGSLVQITQADNTVIRTYEYDLDKRLTQVTNGQGQTLATYSYDPFGKRLSKTVNGQTTYYFYAQEGLVAELNASGQIQTQYGYEPNSTWGTNPVYIQQGTGTNSQLGFYQNDHLGTPQQIINTSGQILWQASYSPFGEAAIQIEQIENNLRLAGQYYDAETNLHYNYHRYYNPQLGRYISQDPIGLAGGINGYVYVYNNPLGLIDPLGLDPLKVNSFELGITIGFIGGISYGVSIDKNTGDIYLKGGVGVVMGASAYATASNAQPSEGYSVDGSLSAGVFGIGGVVNGSWDAQHFSKTGEHKFDLPTVDGGVGVGASSSLTFTGTWKIGNLSDFQVWLDSFAPDKKLPLSQKDALPKTGC